MGTEVNEIIKAAVNITSKIKEVKDASINFRKGSKQNFNFFYGIVGEKTYLEKYHTNFIAYLLDPYESHDCEFLFFNNFLKIIEAKIGHGSKNKISDLFPSENELNNIKCANIDRYTDDDRKIDITIESKQDWILWIENKFNHWEENNQIKDYYNFSKKFNKRIPIFLTKNGDSPETIDEKKDEIICLSYKEDIIQWIESCFFEKEIIHYPHIISALKQYIDIVKYHLKIMEDKEMKEIIDYLIDDKNYNNVKLIISQKQNLNDAIKEYIKQIRKDFFKEVTKKVHSNFEKIGIKSDGFIEQNAKCYLDSSYFNILIGEEDDGEDGGLGSFWGVYDCNDYGLACGLEHNNWEEIHFSDINDFIEDEKGSLEIIDSIKDLKKRTSMINEINQNIISSLKKVLPAIKEELRKNKN